MTCQNGQPCIRITEPMPNACQVADGVRATVESHGEQQQNKSPPGQWLDPAPEGIPEQGKQPDPGIEGDHPVRPGDLPTHCWIAGEHPQNHWIVRVLPGRLNLAQGIHGFFAKQEE